MAAQISLLEKNYQYMFFKKKYEPKFSYDRYAKWVTNSMGWLAIDDSGTLMMKLQGLGIIDAELYDVNRFDIDKSLDHNLTVYDHVNIKSYLWVLGVYEFFRMFDQMLRENPDLADEKGREIINKVKKDLARIRIPLAKMEPSNKYKKIDYAVPKLGADEVQLGWQINDNEVIRYRDLSNSVMLALHQVRASRIKENINKET